MRTSALGLVAVLFCLGDGLVSAQESVKKSDDSADAVVTAAPEAREFLVVPLRVHVLKSKDLPDADCSLTDDDVRRIVGKVNKVWSVAGIHFGLESIRREEAADVASFKERAPEKGAAPLGLYRTLAPRDSRSFDGQHVYYIHKFAVNGVHLGGGVSFVQETAKLRKVPGGIDEPLPRVTAHELGHALGLPHRQDVVNLLASGTTGTALNRAEVEKTRGVAKKLKGVVPFDDLDKTAPNGKAWAEAVEKLAAGAKPGGDGDR